MSRYTMHEITVQPDTRFPVCPDNGSVLEGRVSGTRVLGWYTEAEFQRWLEARSGGVVETNGDKRVIVALLTKKEAHNA